jgi:signal transduction histidine kinase/uncharacterized protein YoaH (UPF0181 family)
MGRLSSEGAREAQGLADQQAALRRVATLVARGIAPEETFRVVAAEVGQVLDVEATFLSCYDAGGVATIVGAWARAGDLERRFLGAHIELGGRNVHTLIFETNRPARIDDCAETFGPAARVAPWLAIRSRAGVPINVEGRLWGMMSVAWAQDGPLPADTEERLVEFTELVAAAIANAQARTELRAFADEQAALRRVAVLVARGGSPEDVFTSVAEEVGRLVGADHAAMCRYEQDHTVTVFGAWARPGATPPLPVGSRWALGGHNVSTQVFETGRATRIDDYSHGTGPAARLSLQGGVRSGVGAPVRAEGRLWGVIILTYAEVKPLPAAAEARLAGFTELVTTALANAQARAELRRYTEEEAALRRVATLVARGTPAEQLFSAVTAEVGRLFSADFSFVVRYDLGGDTVASAVGAWTSTGTPPPFPIGKPVNFEGHNVTALVFHTRRPARVEGFGEDAGDLLQPVRDAGVRSVVGAPVSVEGRLWGAILVGSTREDRLPPDTESRLAGFTELVATALANAEIQGQLMASRARIVAAADATRRRIERDLHDGAQQRLVGLALELRSAQALVPPEAPELRARLDRLLYGLSSAVEEMREFARGIHPSTLADGGLRSAIKTLARRSPIPVEVDVLVKDRLPEPLEVCAYYVISEALANAAKHSSASAIGVEVTATEGSVVVRVTDDGAGGADFEKGSGLVGLRDRVEALGGGLPSKVSVARVRL